MSYNGYTNRATWVVNLHWSDDEETIRTLVREANGDLDTLAESIEALVYDYVNEQVDCPFVKDLLTLSEVNWLEIADLWSSDYADDMFE